MRRRWVKIKIEEKEGIQEWGGGNNKTVEEGIKEEKIEEGK